MPNCTHYQANNLQYSMYPKLSSWVFSFIFEVNWQMNFCFLNYQFKIDIDLSLFLSSIEQPIDLVIHLTWHLPHNPLSSTLLLVSSFETKPSPFLSIASNSLSMCSWSIPNILARKLEQSISFISTRVNLSSESFWSQISKTDSMTLMPILGEKWRSRSCNCKAMYCMYLFPDQPWQKSMKGTSMRGREQKRKVSFCP